MSELEAECSADGQQTEVEINSSNSNVVKRRKRDSEENQSSVEKVLEFLGKRNSSNNDPTEQLFIGFAKSVKTFSMRRQTWVKMKIAQLILEEELKDWEERSSVITRNPNIN